MRLTLIQSPSWVSLVHNIRPWRIRRFLGYVHNALASYCTIYSIFFTVLILNDTWALVTLTSMLCSISRIPSSYVSFIDINLALRWRTVIIIISCLISILFFINLFTLIWVITVFFWLLNLGRQFNHYLTVFIMRIFKVTNWESISIVCLSFSCRISLHLEAFISVKIKLIGVSKRHQGRPLIRSNCSNHASSRNTSYSSQRWIRSSIQLKSLVKSVLYVLVSS